jgi:cytochrome o ubiquinol oxidase subunit IV
MSDKLQSQPNYGTSPKNLKTYLIGFVLCIVLTLIPFQAVASHSLSHAAIYAVLFVSAILQLFVQVICFLRLNMTKDGLENTLSFIFIAIVVFILIGGSMWIMWHLNYNMVS